MGIVEDVKSMKDEGRSDSEIIEYLSAKGISQREILDAMTQTKIKGAIENPGASAPQPLAGGPPVPAARAEAFRGMQPSMMGAAQEEAPVQETQPAPSYPAYPPEYPSAQQAYPAAQPYQTYPAEAYPAETAYQGGYQQGPTLSSDTITEISEQVVNEKLSPLKDQLEQVIDLKTTMDARIESIDERLSRIEKIIDRLQLSILQKVGEYTTGMEDLKKEIVETQKSFKSLLPDTAVVKKKSPGYI